MKRFLLGFLSIVALLVLGMNLVVAQDEAQVQATTILQVVDTSPQIGEELDLQGDIVVYFDRALDCETIRGGFSIVPDVAGLIDCGTEGLSLVFTPQQVLERGLTYTITVEQALQAENGGQLLEPYVFELTTVGFLEVSQVLPSPDTIDVQSESVITVIFNRPVVPLGIDLEDLPSPVTIAPDVAGSGEWVNTSIYTFTPETALAGGTTYTVTADAGLEAVDGAILNMPFSWSFSTALPRITAVIPEDATGDVRLDENIQMTFNQPMNQANVEANFLLYRDDVGASGDVEGTFEWSEDGTGFMFLPSVDTLDMNALYRIGFANPPEGISGGALTGYAGTAFSTVPFPAIVGTDPFDGQIDVHPFGGLRIFFTSPMDAETFEGRFTIEPEPWYEPEFYYYEWDNSLQVTFPTEPSTDYRITIASGLADIYGNTIDSDLSFGYRTAPYDPDVTLRVPGPVGFYDAYRPETQVFISHRNTSRLDLQLYNVNLSEFGARLLDINMYNPTEGFYADPSTLLRSWQIDSTTPENSVRYELLDLADTSIGTTVTSEQCANALPQRVRVGDSAIVITEPDPLRARSEPIDGEIVELLYRDYVFTVVDGPVCDSGLTWWGIQLRDNSVAWVAEGVGDEYFIDLRAPAETIPVTVPTDGGIDAFVDENSLIPGIYYLSANSPETQALGWNPLEHFMVVSTANLMMQSSLDSVVIWATDVNTGDPIAGELITLYATGFNEIVTGVTDENGLLRLETPRANDLYEPLLAVLDTPEHFGIGSNRWTDSIEPYNFGQEAVFYPPRYSVYMYTDRPIYRPDQPVYFRGVIRSVDDVTYTPPELGSVPVQIFNAEGEVIYDRQLPITEFGTFSDEIDISADASLGYYRLVVNLSDPASYRFDGGEAYFNVAEFRLPEFQVTVESETSEVVQNETINVTVDSRFFFGGVVSDAEVEYNVVATPYLFDYEGVGRYDFTDFDPDGGPGAYYGTTTGVVASGVGRTDDAGLLTIEVPADIGEAVQSQVFTIEAVVTDESDQAVAGRAEVVVHQGELYIGARPENYVNVAEQASLINFVAVDWESNAIANQSIDVEIVERRWFSVQEQDPNGRTVWTWDFEEIPVIEADVQTDDAGRASYQFTPPNGGIFKVIISTLDEQGNEVRASTTMWVSSREYVSWRQQNSNRIDLVPDQTDYNVGDTAQILITSPFQGEVNALVSVLRGDVLVTDYVVMDSNSYVYELPITADYAPNVYVSVMIVAGVSETNPVTAFRMGQVRLGVDNTQQELTLEITPNSDQAGPGDTVTYTVRALDYFGNPVQAEVGVGLTDLASLSIAEPNSIPMLSHFYGRTGLAVRTSTILTINTDQITQTVLDTIKGGGGGFGDGGIFDIREDFVDTAYWNANLVTDENGIATFDVTLPDNLTTWRLDARAVTSGVDGRTLVGQDTFDLLSTRPLLIRPVTPRFFVVGDQVVLGAVVNNNTDSAQVVDVTLDGTGIVFEDEAVQQVVIPAGGRERINWSVTIENVDAVDVTFFVVNEDATFADASDPMLGQGDENILPVYRYEAADIVGTGGVLRQIGNQTEAIVLPRRYEVSQGELQINLEPSLAATVINSFDYLAALPHESAESTVSRFLPNIATLRALESLGIEGNDTLRAQLDGTVNLALQRLYNQQKVDGGWGWFVQDVSNPLLTAYAVLGFVEARNAGFTVDQGVLDRAVGYLQTQYIAIGLNVPNWQLDRQAFIVYATQRAGAPNVAQISVLFDNRSRLSQYARALLALTIHSNDPNDSNRLNVLLSDFMSNAIVSANGVHWEEAERDFFNWNTDTRSTAMILQAILRISPSNDLIPNVVRWLMVARTADVWETTQETVWATLALTDYMLISGELRPDYSFGATLNDSVITQGNATSATATIAETLFVDVASLLQDQANLLMIDRGDGVGVLYYTAYLRALLPVPEIEPVNRGIIIERQYTRLDDPERESVTEASVGELIQVRLTIIAPNDLHYVVIEDPIPAGAEAVNPELAISQQVGTRPEIVVGDPLSYGWGWWYFSNIDFRDEKVVMNSSYLPAGTYEYVYTLRTGLAGVYNVIPATGREFYFPEVFGRSAGMTFTITADGEE